MKFTALPVKEGDSFLLETSRKKILVDTGLDENECRDFILNKNIDRLDLVIITHYDKDHVNGLFNLLKSKISITEVWLPEIIGRISKSVKQNENNLLKRIIEYRSQFKEDKLEIIVHTISTNNVRHIEILEIANESNKLVSIIHPSKEDNGNNKKWKEKIDNEIICLTQLDSDIIIAYINKNHIKKICEIVDVCKKKTNIRWLKYTGEYKVEKLSPNMNVFGMNCKENKNIKEYSNDIETILQLSNINRESLVFKYNFGRGPNILFSSDSGFEFLNVNQKIDLYNNSLVTASHHGSGDKLNLKTYNLVSGNNLIYIRSDKLNKYRPCWKYTKLEKKYCTVCNYPPNNTKNEVNLIYKSLNWNTKNNLCSCQNDC